MKRLHPSDHEEAMPKKFPRTSLVEEEEDDRDEERTEEGVKKKDFKGVSKADKKGVDGEEDNKRVSCQNKVAAHRSFTPPKHDLRRVRSIQNWCRLSLIHISEPTRPY